MKLPTNYNKLSTANRKLVREEYVALQNGRCYYCQAPLAEPPSQASKDQQVNRRLFPRGFFNTSVHLHHSHATGLTIGAVHAHCNAVL